MAVSPEISIGLLQKLGFPDGHYLVQEVICNNASTRTVPVFCVDWLVKNKKDENRLCRLVFLLESII
jgi:hypothetical protein